MKRILLAATAVLAVAAAHPAVAADAPVSKGPAPMVVAPANWYVELGGGVGWYPDVTWQYSDQGHAQKFHPGWIARLAVGRYLWSGVRVELEGAYRSNEANRTVTSVGGPFDIDGTARVWSLMANAYYDFTALQLGRIVPFVGVGIGWAHVNLNTNFTGFAFVQARGSDDRLAWQLMAGLAVPITERAALTAQYTYFDTAGDRMGVFNTGLGNTTITAPYRNHSVTLGLRLGF
jgi:opacity protein-like surface antigen